MRSLFAMITLFLVSPSWAEAQGPVQVYGGDRVRVTAPECQLEELTAALVSMEDGVLSATSGGREIQCPVGAVTRLEVSLGDREWYEDSVKGMKYGALLGLAAGGVLVATSDLDNDTPAVDAILITLGMGATGFLVGTGIGALRDPEDWVDVPLTPARPSPAFAKKKGLRLGFSIPFRE